MAFELSRRRLRRGEQRKVGEAPREQNCRESGQHEAGETRREVGAWDREDRHTSGKEA